MSLRKETSGKEKSGKEKSGTDKPKKKSSHRRLTSSTKPPAEHGTLSPRSIIDPSLAGYDLLTKEQIRDFKVSVLDIAKEKYPKTVKQFIKFIKIYRTHNTDTRRAILEDNEIIEKITAQMISTFSKKQALRANLADAFIEQGIQEDELKHFEAILLNKNVNEHLKKDTDNAILLEDNIGKLCADIKEKMKKTITITSSTPKKKGGDNPFEDEDQPVNTDGNPFENMPSTAEPPRPVQAESVITPPMPRNLPPPASVAIVYSAESETADREIDVILSSAKKHLERLKEQAQFDPLKKDVYYKVDNLYNQCHTSIKAQQRATNDITHRSILKSNECILLKELDLVLVSVYKPNDIRSISTDQFGRNIHDKRKALLKFDSACKQRHLPEMLGKIAAAIGIALSITVACAVLGALVGIAATDWSGPGMALGAFKGASIGWAEGIIVGAVFMGISVSTVSSVFGLFKDSDMQKQINAVKDKLTTVVENEDKLKLAP